MLSSLQERGAAWSLAVLFAAGLQAADPYVSDGFLAIPSSVQLESVSAVAVGEDEQVYVLHRGEPPILVFDKNGKYERGFGGGMFKVAHGLRFDGNGNLWATDNGLHVLYKFSPEGELLATVGHRGEAGREKGYFKSPDDLVFSSKGEIYLADAGNGRVVRLAPSGEMIGEWGRKGKGQSEFAAAHGIAIDGNDRIYVADRGNNRVQVFSSDGKFVAAWTGFGNPFGLLVVGNELLVTDGDAHQISHLRLRDGGLADQWGDPGMLQLPHLMAVDSTGRLYVAEVNGKRVQRFRLRNGDNRR